jgi:hypothetical protein
MTPWGPRRWLFVGGVAAVTGACGSTVMAVGDAGTRRDATADHQSPGSLEGDGGSSDAQAADGGSSAQDLDAAVVVIPCTVGDAYLTCTFAGGGGCACVTDLATCSSDCDAAGCPQNCAPAPCTNRCAPDQVAMGCGGGPRISPPDASPQVRYVYAGPPSGCAVAPDGIYPEVSFYCCPRTSADR